MELARKGNMSNQEAERWISVKDRLPEPEVSVLTYSPHGLSVQWREFMSEIDDYAWRMMLPNPLAIGGINPITHWMPLPASPKADAGGEKV